MNEKELRELDAWIAEHVMGWRGIEWFQPDSPRLADRQPKGFYRSVVNGVCVAIPAYTTSPADAMMVLERCQKHGTTLALNLGSSGQYWVSDCDKKARYAVAETLPLAIALFAKKLFSK